MYGKTKAQMAFATGFSSELICKGYTKISWKITAQKERLMFKIWCSERRVTGGRKHRILSKAIRWSTVKISENWDAMPLLYDSVYLRLWVQMTAYAQHTLKLTQKGQGAGGRGNSYTDIKCLPRKEGLKENLILVLKSLIYSHCFCQYDISQGHLGRETLSGENAAIRLACGAFLDCWLTWEGPAHCGQCYTSIGRWFWAV